MSSQLASMIVRDISAKVKISMVGNQSLRMKFETVEQTQLYIMELSLYSQYNFSVSRDPNDDLAVVVFCS